MSSRARKSRTTVNGRRRSPHRLGDWAAPAPSVPLVAHPPVSEEAVVRHAILALAVESGQIQSDDRTADAFAAHIVGAGDLVLANWPDGRRPSSRSPPS